MKIIAAIFIAILISCSNTKVDSTNDILSENKLINILKEVHLAEADFELTKNNGLESANNKLANAYFNIYKKHQITEDKFKKTLNLYSENPEKLKHVYSDILQQLIKERSKLDQK